MRFDCGLSLKERFERRKQLGKEWRTVFAWFPVRVGKRDCRWLEYVQMKETYRLENLGYDIQCWWEREWRASE